LFAPLTTKSEKVARMCPLGRRQVIVLSDVDKRLLRRDARVAGVVEPLPASNRVEEEMKTLAVIAGTRSVATLKERQEEAPMRHTHRRLLGGVLVASLAVLLAGTMLQPAKAAPIKWQDVQLGAHRFGHLRAPDAVVASAGPKDVGFLEPPPNGGCGCYVAEGPSSFDVARDGSIWLLDELNHQLLVWQPGRPTRPVRSVRLPRDLRVVDFALGPDGTIYAYAIDLGSGHRNLYALTPSGGVRWKAPTTIEIGNAQLLMGSDGALYTPDGGSGLPMAWTPLTTTAGQPLPLAEQRRRASRFQPLPGGLRLVTTQPSSHEVRFALINGADQVVHAWRVTSQSELGLMRATPAVVGDDLVVAIGVSRQAKHRFLLEHLVLRLSAANGTPQQFALDARAVWGDESGTSLRVGPDGQLYQLRTDPTTGASISRYSLGPTQVAPLTATPARVAPSATGPSVIQRVVATPPVTVLPIQPATPGASEPASRWIIPGLAALGIGGLAALGVWLLYRRRHPVGPGRRDPSVSAH
jgi:hypothetical protein